ncbi:MAG: TIM barrel protein [Steroidobacteraceae bacterium]
MPRLAANLSTLFRELPFRERFGAAAAAGFRYVEYQFPYAEGSAADVAAWARAAGLQVVLHNLPPGDLDRGDRGLACLAGREAEFRDGVERAIDYARAACCPRLNCLVGVAPPDVPPTAVLATLVANLRHAADRLAAAGLTLLIEPLNVRSTPGYLLTRSAEALEVIRAVDRPNLRLQYDLFHMQISEGDLFTTLHRILPDVGHVQIAGVPERAEPDVGEVNFPWLLGQLDALGYEGWVGCEYTPRAQTLAGLGWARRWLQGEGR